MPAWTASRDQRIDGVDGLGTVAVFHNPQGSLSDRTTAGNENSTEPPRLSWLYRWYFRAHSLKSLERNILGFVGSAPVHETLIGMVGNMLPALAGKWLSKLEKLGAAGG